MSKYEEIRDYGTNQFTLENDAAIELLKYIGRHWPDSLWLFAADGKLYVMKYNEDGEHVIIDHTGQMDPQYMVNVIDIDTDSGDW